MPMIAQKPPYTLIITDDNDPLNPREDCDNFGKMMCWHKRYRLGDKHDFEKPIDFLADLCLNTVPASEIAKRITENKFDYLRFTPDEEEKDIYYLEYYDENFKKWYVEATYDEPPENMYDKIADAAVECIETSDLVDLASEYNVILPLYLYDHSGITMNTTGFYCIWDSGQVGWIYADYDTIKKEYGEITPETLEKAEALLKAEAEDYDCFISGQCYGFKLFEGQDMIDSCWGFIGDLSDIQKDVKEHLG